MLTAKTINMKKVLILIICFSAIDLYSQNTISNEVWYWNSTNGENSFDLYLDESGSTNLIGYHCSSFYQGKKIDCMEESQNCSINLTSVGPNIYEGTIKSGYSLTQGTIRITFYPNEDKLFFELLTKPNGEFYIPNDVYLHN